jgi:uncharacterized protein with GYD domain
MSKFLMQVSFTRDGIRGLAKEGGTKRRQAVQEFFGTAGGKLETLYFAFGDTDVLRSPNSPIMRARRRFHLLPTLPESFM